MDDLLDLSFTPSSSQPTKQTATAGKSSFDYLVASAATASSGARAAASTTRSPSPLLPRAAPVSRSTTPTTSTQPRPSSSQSNQTDAFAGLFGSSTAASTANTAKLTMAQRLEQQRQPSSLAGAAAGAGKKDDTWDFDLLSAPANPTSVPRQAAPVPVHVRQDSFDLLDGFSAPSLASKETDAPSFGFNNDVPAADGSDEDDDLLAGMSSSRPARPAAAVRATNGSGRKHTSTPPPHVLGQLVEMGYSITTAQAALEATYSEATGWDVERAIEAIVEQERVSDRTRQTESDARLVREGAFDHNSRGPSPADQHERTRQRRKDYMNDSTDGTPTTSRPSRPNDRQRSSADDGNITKDKLGIAADQLLTQASSFGLSMFKSANAYWETGKAQVQKKLNELDLTGPAASSGNGASQDRRKPGKPKWMTEESEEVGTRGQPAANGGFRDSDDETEEPRPSFTSGLARQPTAPPQEPVLLFDDQVVPTQPKPTAAAAAYKSPFRRGKTQLEPQPAPTASSSRTPSPRPATPRRQVRRDIEPVSAAVLSRVATLREKGNESFRLGQYGPAAESYAAALDLLPSKHVRRAPLLNNHAAALAKNGEDKAVLDMTDEAIAIVTVDGTYELGELEETEVEECKPKEAWAKAMSRRAKALEGVERWREASGAWEALMGKGDAVVRAAGGAKAIADGRERCRKMLDPSPPATRQPAPSRPRTTAVPAVRKSTPVTSEPSGQAVSALREQHAAAAAEEDMRLSLVDSVDARIQSWKGGKETNLRALISSLDSVLWPELGWKKVGLNELLTESQLKVRYMRAVAKVHPDKLGNANVEQKMIAGAVFAALNEAWNASRT